MKNADVKSLVLLEVIRNLKVDIPYPVSEDWGYLEELVTDMELEGLLSIDRDHYRVTQDGKKFLLLFRADVREISEPVQKFKEVVLNGELTDARMPMMAYVASMDLVYAESNLRAGVYGVFWDDLVETVLGLAKTPDVIWQKALVSDEIYRDLESKINVEAWKELAPDSIEARRIGKWLLNPNQMVQTVR